MRDAYCPPFIPMHTILTPVKNGKYAIEMFDIDEKTARFELAINRTPGLRPGRYARLMRGSTVVMSDTPYERRMCYGAIINAKGNVLVGGLGIGMVLLPILRKPEVTRVTVVEIEPAIIGLVASQIAASLPADQAAKLHTVQGDIFTHEPRGGYNTVWLDIWDDICADNWDGMKTLRRRYSRRHNPDAWIGCWADDEIRYQLQQGDCSPA